MNMIFTANRPSRISTITSTEDPEAELIVAMKFNANKNAPIAAAMLRTKWKCPTTKYVSWYVRSIAWFASNSPVNPPNTKQTTNPKTITNSKLRSVSSLNPRDHEKIFMAVGIPIIAVAAEKYTLEISDIPTVNMWCAQTK